MRQEKALWGAQCCLRAPQQLGRAAWHECACALAGGRRKAGALLTELGVVMGALVLRSRSLVGLSQPPDERRAKFSQRDPPEVHFETQGGSVMWRGDMTKAGWRLSPWRWVAGE